MHVIPLHRVLHLIISKWTIFCQTDIAAIIPECTWNEMNKHEVVYRMHRSIAVYLNLRSENDDCTCVVYAVRKKIGLSLNRAYNASTLGTHQYTCRLPWNAFENLKNVPIFARTPSFAITLRPNIVFRIKSLVETWKWYEHYNKSALPHKTSASIDGIHKLIHVAQRAANYV